MALTELQIHGEKYAIGYDGPQTYEGRDLSSYQWSDFQNMCKDVDFSEIRVGDYKSFQLGDETIVMEVAGIDTYYNTGGEEKWGEYSCEGLAPIPHHIDFISRNCLKTGYKWNANNRNSGTGTGTDDGTDQPFLTSDIRKTLNETIWTNIPEDIKSAIIPKINILERRAYKADAPLTDSTGWHWYNMGNLWLPTEYEVFGSVIWGTKGFSAAQAMQYPIFANSWKHRLKNLGETGSRCTWWLCTASSGYSTNCCYVSFAGLANTGSASNSNGVPVCFRVSDKRKA